MVCQNPNKFFPAATSLALPKGSMANKIALVTGGGTGLGRAIATTFAALGAKVAICGRREKVLRSTADEIKASTGGEVEPFQLDIRDPQMISSTFDEVEKRFGNLPNVLVNNAAGNFIAPTERLSPNAVQAIVKIVLLGTIDVTNELGRRVIKRGEGLNVLSITSPYARAGAPFMVPSVVSKAGVEKMTISLASEWMKYGIRLNCIAPGPIPTKAAFGNLSARTFEETIDFLASGIPVGRVGTKEELGNLASFICSDFGNWMNGSIIDFDGGQQHLNHGSSADPALHEFSKEDWDKVQSNVKILSTSTKK